MEITLAPHIELEWQRHPMPNAAYIVSGELTLERKKDGKKQHFAAGQVVSETVDTVHRGLTGNETVEFIVSYAGSPGASHSVSLIFIGLSPEMKSLSIDLKSSTAVVIARKAAREA